MFDSPQNITQLDDAQLLKLKMSKKVWAELYCRYAALVFGVCMKYLKNSLEAEDATANIFESLPHLLTKNTIHNFRPWLHTVTKNHCLMLLRKKNHDVDFEECLPYEAISEESNDVFQKEMKLGRLDECLRDLKEEQAKCVSLFYLEQMSYQSIAEQTGQDIKKVKSAIQNGKRNLKICIESKK